MVLISILLVLLLALGLIRFSFLEVLNSVAEKTHNYCLNIVPDEIQYKAEISALVCAQNFSKLSESNLYITSGLIHLFVVSGAHLIVLESLLKKLKINDQFILIILIIYGFACDLNAPIVRSLIAYILNYTLNRKKIIWPAHFKLFIVGTLTIGLNPAWISSLSLQMSWIAAFMVMLGEVFFKSASVVFKQSLFFFSLLPTFVFFQVPSPVIILVNLILAPALELILFPLGLLTFLFNFLSPLFDALIDLFKYTLSLLELDYHFQLATIPSEMKMYNWCLIFSLHFIFHIIYVQKKREAYYK